MQIFLCPVKVAEWPPFWKYLLPQFTIRSLCIMFVVLVIFHFGFDDRILVLVVPVPGHCLSFYFYGCNIKPSLPLCMTLAVGGT